jgi:CRP-like cAMP-binding protein
MKKHPHFLFLDLFRDSKNEKASLIQILKENILFSTLNRSELETLSKIVYERVYVTEEHVFRQNDRGFGMFLIAEGSVAIKTQSTQGEILVTTLRKGSFFGELSLVEPNYLRSATATAQERSVLIGFFKPDLMEILERRPAMGVKILYQLTQVLSKRLLETTDRLGLLTQVRGVAQVHGDVL